MAQIEAALSFALGMEGMTSDPQHGVWTRRTVMATTVSPTHHNIPPPYNRTAAPIRADSWAARAKRRISRPCSPVRLGGSPLK